MVAKHEMEQYHNERPYEALGQFLRATIKAESSFHLLKNFVANVSKKTASKKQQISNNLSIFNQFKKRKVSTVYSNNNK